MDRRNLDLNPTSSVSCIQSKNLLMHWDLEQNDPIALRLNKHLKECSACQKAQAKLEQKAIELKLQIPMPVMALDSKESFFSEMNELFKRLELSKNQTRKKRVGSKINRLNENCQALYQVIFSKQMLPVYGLSIFTYILLTKLL